ncbi:MAG: DUF1566 domain-containing protein [Treponema sp.]|nr:DUF1566 domain-containing protein [Treponema sp.]
MIKTLGIIAIIAIIGLSMVTCSTDPCEDGHTFPNWTNPTCTVAGNSVRTCLNCTETDTRTSGFALLEHSFGWQETRTGVEIETCQNAGCEESDIRLTLALGDTGPAGGKIIYRASTGFTVKSTTIAFTTYTAYYLEAAPANAVGGTEVQTTMRWSTRTDSPYPDVTGTGLGIGSGRNNTALIITAEKAAYPSNTYIYAALACANYSVAGFNDWFLPSRDELNAMYIARAAPNNIAGLPTTGWLWSSSQSSVSFAWAQLFESGYQGGLGKANDGSVRPVRAF